jgi:CrcB protein
VKYVLLVAAGGSLGAVARYLVGLFVLARLGAGWAPWGTFAVNASGAFLLGCVLGLVEAGALPGWARPLLAVGVLGGYTTFSTFSVETLRLLTGGGSGLALLNLLGQPFVGLAVAYLGVALVRTLVG